MQEPNVKNRIPIILALIVLGLIGIGVYAYHLGKKPALVADSDNEPVFPSKLDTKYITAVEWPPQFSLENTEFKCVKGGVNSYITTTRVINGQTYCLTEQSEGAAGSVYTTYIYKWPKDNQTAALTFTLKSVQCSNYNEPQKSECEKERTEFNADDFVKLLK